MLKCSKFCIFDSMKYGKNCAQMTTALSSLSRNPAFLRSTITQLSGFQEPSQKYLWTSIHNLQSVKIEQKRRIEGIKWNKKSYIYTRITIKGLIFIWEVLKIAGLDLVKLQWKSLAYRPHLALSVSSGQGHNLAMVTVTAAENSSFLVEVKV